MRTLVLDQSYRPINAVEWGRAVGYIVRDRADVLEEYDVMIHPWMQMPAVVRLRDVQRRDKQRVKFSRVNVLSRDHFKCQYCLAPEHRVLTADLRWIPLGDLRVGEALVGLEEFASSARLARRYKRSVVEDMVFEKAKLYRVVLDNGQTFRATADHLWLAKNSANGGKFGWCSTARLRGKHLPRVFDTWESETTWESGWLAGIFDGEGWLSLSKFALAVAQNDGAILNRVRLALAARSFTYTVNSVDGGDCLRLSVNGAKGDKIRLLGSLRPIRLLQSFDPERLGRVRALACCKVLGVIPDGEGDIVKMRTSTGTFFADGFPQHNCGRKLPTAELTYDHVVPRAQGGKTVWENIVACCAPCNSAKANRTPAQADMKLLHKPERPTWVASYNPRLRIPLRDVPSEWRSYWTVELEP